MKADLNDHPHLFRDAVLTLAGIGVILALLRMSATIVEPILLSLLLVAILSPGLGWLRRIGVPTGVSIFAGLVVAILLLSAFSIFLSGVLSEFSAVLPEYEVRLAEHSSRIDHWFAGRGIDLHKGGVLYHFSPERLVELGESIISHLGSALSDAVLILFIVIFMLAEAAHFPRKIAAMMGSGGAAVDAMANLVPDMKRYLSAKAAVSVVTGFLIWVGLKAFGLEYAELWASLAFLLNFIPNVGSILAAIPAVIVALLHDNPLYAAGVAALYLVVNLLIGNVAEPILVGQKIGLSAVTVLLSLVFWGWMFGIVGMLVSVPLTMAIKTFAGAYPPTRWLAILMSPTTEEDDSEASGLSAES